ncbi:unnamed protein product [Symbiodinium natans]|uniref:C3H1-type domain-containing protein n=1 Tax=Symbiodinium natans TaxID=878477 RepID=A0A812T1A8_9DINO|nr:unnamed protein product [Symbiodinium natans]
MTLQLPVQKREVCHFTSDLGTAPRPQTPDTRSPSALSTETFGDGRDTDEASTPRNLWPATPTPSPRYLEAPLNFMMPPVGPCTDSTASACPEMESRYTQLNAHAKAFVPCGNYSCTPPLEQRFQAPSDPESVASSTQGVAAQVTEEPPCVPSSVSQGGFAASLDIPNMGSALHTSGDCKPCAWFWKSRGCTNGYACDYCHLCPAGALKV